MTVAQGALVIVDLGTPRVKYFWRGVMLTSIVSVFVYRGTSLTVRHNGLDNAVISDMRAYGIKVKEQR